MKHIEIQVLISALMALDDLPCESIIANCSTSLPIRLASTTSGTKLVILIRNLEAKAAETWVNTFPDRNVRRY